MNLAPTVAVEDFIAVARAFCSWCEDSPFESRPEIAASSWLAKLHASALALPQLEPESDHDWPDIPLEAHEAAKSNLAIFNGFYYREYFDPDPTLTDQSGMGDVGDDLLDTYQDVRRGLIFHERGKTMEAVWHWRFHHRVHWGRHAVGAMFALHCLVSKFDGECA